MTSSLMVGGLALLVLLAVLVGLSNAADRQSQSSAWRRIAAARKEISEEWRRLELASKRINACARCPFRRPDKCK